MNLLALQNAEEDALASAAPHLSHSRLNRYLLCPEQYRLYYVVGLRPKVPGASLVFGLFIHQALAILFTSKGDPVTFFQELWSQVKDAELRYSCRESWETLHERGARLLDLFVREHAPKIANISGVEKPFQLTISNLDLPFVGILDLVADVDGQKTVVDFKTASTSYEEYEVALSDQLTAYRLAEPSAERCALCVLVKTKEPRIEWYFTNRMPEQALEYLDKAEVLGHAINARCFFKRPGKWCAWCDFLPFCLGDNKTTEQQFVRCSD